MAECEELGRDEFLRRYGFGEARTYFLEYDGKRYDSKAIAGVAHKHEFNAALTSSEFSGGDRTVAAKLNQLGFIVTRPAPTWRIPIGRVTTRSDVKAEYGGSIYGGIEPSNTSPNVMVYSDPSEGEQHGYQFDGWVDGEPGVFLYTGEGRYGDQQLTEGNRAILEHERDERVLRLFFTLEGPSQPGGKLQRYVGAFRVDPQSPYEWRTAPDSDGTLRKVVVFRLVADEVDGYPAVPMAHPALAVGRRQAPPEREVNVCPTHFIQLSVTGECDMCE